MTRRRTNEKILTKRRAIDDLRMTILEAEQKISSGCKGMDLLAVQGLKRRLKSCRKRLQKLLGEKGPEQQEMFKPTPKKVGRRKYGKRK